MAVASRSTHHFAHKVIVLFLLFNICLNQFTGYSAVKEWVTHFSSVLSHFNEHQQEDHGLTIYQFLKLHFGDLATDHLPQHDHSDLPFQCHHSDQMVVSIAVYPPEEVAFVKPPLYKVNAYRVPFNSHLRLNPSIDNIWQPPKHC